MRSVAARVEVDGPRVEVAGGQYTVLILIREPIAGVVREDPSVEVGRCELPVVVHIREAARALEFIRADVDRLCADLRIWCPRIVPHPGEPVPIGQPPRQSDTYASINQT